ncbi:MAG TPA: PAS domain S-box protein [Gemmatimonadaceae bacterium]|nr:PAS domain S-box protein [Gemmatimonadaceae bacterium]
MAGRSSRRGSTPASADGAQQPPPGGRASGAAPFFELVFAASPDGVLLIDPETQRAVQFNDAACRQLGYTRQEFAGLRISDYEALETPDVTRAHVQRALEAGQSEFDTVHRTRSGDLRHVHVWIHAVDLEGRRAFYTIFRDVTDQRRVEDALRHSHDLLDRTGRMAEVGGWQLDVDTQTLHWTAEVYRIHGVAPTYQPSVAAAIEFYAPEARPVIAAAIADAIADGTAFDLELPLVTARGTRIWVRAQGAAERRDGRTTHLHGAFQDISERKQADELRRLQGAALQAAANAVVISDRNGTIQWVNPAFTRLTGYTAAEAVGQNPRNLVKSGKHPPEFYRSLWETITAGRTWHGETINRRKDGSLYTEEQAITPIVDAAGVITHFVAIKTDVTERLKLEAQFRQAQKMDTVGQLASGIAHDFNNLLTVINGVGELVLQQVSVGDPIHADVQEVLQAGERAAALTRQLLAFSRRQMLRPEVIDLNAVVDASERLLRRLLGEDIELVVSPAADLGRVKADPGQIEQVVINLAVNARDAMPQGGRLSIETRNVTVDEAYAGQMGFAIPAGPYVQLSVSDTGVGMDEATRLRVFEPFFTTKEMGKGTGLGLSTVYGIVKQSTGFIWVYSEPGKGTSFRIFLPRVTDAVSPRPRPVDSAVTGTETILLVEDSAGLHTLVTRILQSGGYTVIGATSGAEALQALARVDRPVHLLLTDVVMPQMSGRQLVERMAQVAPATRVLYMSGYTDDMMVRHGVVDAAVAFLSKPFTATMLLQKVREVLDA